MTVDPEKQQILDELIAQARLDAGQPYWSERLDWLNHVEQWLNSLKDWGWTPEERFPSCLRCGLKNVTVNHLCIFWPTPYIPPSPRRRWRFPFGRPAARPVEGVREGKPE